MQRMSGYDAQFIYDESPKEPQHTLKIAFLNPKGAYSFELVKRGVAARLAHVPPLRWRAVRVPVDLHHPVWVEDAEIRLDEHVRRLAIPSPGGRRELCEVISGIASTPLDPDRPLWELSLLEGYLGDRIVSVLKMSHALADGGVSRDLLERALLAEPSDQETFLTPEPKADAPRESMPSRGRLLADAARDLWRDLSVELPRVVRSSRRARRRRRENRAAKRAARATAFNGPRHCFGGPLGRRRSFAFATVPLRKAREVKSVFGVTVNDVLLATAAGGMRRHLAERGELPTEPITGIMVASTRKESPERRYGNRITNRFLWLPTHLADPVERLHAARDAAASVKREIELSSGAHMEDWMEILPPFVLKTGSRLLRLVARVTEPPGAVVVSNVMGPRTPLYAGAVPIENFVSVGHMKFIAGLNVTVWSYADKLNFALYADAATLPDPGRLADHLAAAFDELVQAASFSRARAA